MAHKTLVGGTAYNVVSGTSMVSGAQYNIVGGKTMVDGTGYDINFGSTKTAMLYSDGSFVFQNGDRVAAGKSLVNSYTEFEDTIRPLWNRKQNSFTSVSFDTEVAPTSMAYWFYDAENMVANIDDFSNLNIDNVTNMSHAYCGCENLRGSPVCGDNVTNMEDAYYGCYNLRGSPVCGDSVINMFYAYGYCENLRGSPVCGDNVTNMSYTYCGCENLRGSPVCGDSVTDMSGAYFRCYNLTGSPVCGNNVTNMADAYYYCENITGNAYFYSPSVSDMAWCFGDTNTMNRLNIYVPANSITNTTIHYDNESSIIGDSITWTSRSNYQYNTAYNIYIYPVKNVAAARAANGD